MDNLNKNNNAYDLCLNWKRAKDSNDKKLILSLMEDTCFILNEASERYYKYGNSTLSDFVYDSLSSYLEWGEKETNFILEISPTNKIGYVIKDELDSVEHEFPSLSLNKTKDRNELKQWLNGKFGCLSWKLDGLTLVLTYENGKLTKAVTRGNGVIGEDITHNAIRFIGIPRKISYKGKLIVRGETLISKKEFERINKEEKTINLSYKNPRNLVSGTVRQKDSSKTNERKVWFKAFTLVYMENTKEIPNEWSKRLKLLNDLGFDVVENKIVNEENLDEIMDLFYSKIDNYEFQTDGLVLFFEDAIYGESLGNTSKYPRGGIAFKWKDETQDTIIKDVIWTEGRTGILTPTAIFETIELEGTEVSKASCHNPSILKELYLGKGDVVSCFKANMIIPQIAINHTRSGNLSNPPKICPYCGLPTTLIEENDSQALYCTNPKCAPKNIEKFSYFCSVNALNIKGLAGRKIEVFINEGFLNTFEDIFRLDRYKEKIVSMEGFGIKSYENIIQSVEKSKKTTLSRFIVALGIDEIGPANAKLLENKVNGDALIIPTLTREDYLSIDGFGEIMADNMINWFLEEENKKLYFNILSFLDLEKKTNNKDEKNNNLLVGKTFVITGNLEKFESRNMAKEWIENLGGKLASSVSSKTFALVNNDKTSNSSKNKKAKELGVKVITEEELISFKF